MNKVLVLSLLLFLTSFSSSAEETCSRTAIINYQEVLVDTDSTKKGEGLRFYLEKDDIAEELLNKYQTGAEHKWHSAALGTIGTGLIISGLFVNSTSNNKSVLYLSGATLLVVNFLMAKTFEKGNEENLIKAVEEYNKRNLPRIDLSHEASSAFQTDTGVSFLFLHKTWDF